MNIVITLPHELVKAILDGKKTIEVRTKIPKDFHKECDVVYVVEKGTNKCPLYFSIRGFSIFNDPFYALAATRNKAYVNERWIKAYLINCNNPVLWYIGRVCPIVYSFVGYKMLRINRNPQCFCYTDLDVTFVSTQGCFWSKDISKEMYDSVFMPDKYFDYFSQFAEAGAPMPWEDYCRTFDIPQNCRGIQL